MRRRTKRIALITGASSGLGAEFARQIDQSEERIDEIWLLARREDRLREVAQSLKKACRLVPMDLTKEENLDALEMMLAADQVRIGLLINCAGFGKIGSYASVDRHQAARMIDLNCKAAVAVSQLALDFMEEGDRILEIVSASAFLPIPGLNVYAASKAFLYAYARALRKELEPRHIAVTAVCPYWIKDTEFIDGAKSTESPDSDLVIRSFPMSSRARKVVRDALWASRKGLALSCSGLPATMMHLLLPLLPTEAVLNLWMKTVK